MPSPWEAALGGEVARLRPELRAYFAALPPGGEGVGSGVFAVVGTPHRWLRPLLTVVGGPSIWPIRAHDVPFEVRNRAVPGPGVAAERRIRVAGRTLAMRDETVATTAGTVVDRIGSPLRIEVALRPSVQDGGLRLDSVAVRLRLGRLRVPLGPLSPRVTLTERFDAGRQHVALRVDVPVIGRIYEYAGTFTYEVRTEQEDR